MDSRQVIRELKRDGWYEVNQAGSHKQFKHPDKLGKVTVAGRESKDLPEDTRKSIFQQAGWED